MQNPKITEIENRFKERIIKVLGFENLVNVTLISLDDIINKLDNDKIGTYFVYEHKTSSTVRFVLYNSNYRSMIMSTPDVPIQA